MQRQILPLFLWCKHIYMTCILIMHSCGMALKNCSFIAFKIFLPQLDSEADFFIPFGYDVSHQVEDLDHIVCQYLKPSPIFSTYLGVEDTWVISDRRPRKHQFCEFGWESVYFARFAEKRLTKKWSLYILSYMDMKLIHSHHYCDHPLVGLQRYSLKRDYYLRWNVMW